MLGDFASIQKCAPEDLRMWKEWLVYGTALGVGDKVVEAMRALNVEIPEIHVASEMHYVFTHSYGLTSPPSSGGGGFGGGGGGAR
jgi:uncharacterized membrane protein